jgi:hypothetical protein
VHRDRLHCQCRDYQQQRKRPPIGHGGPTTAGQTYGPGLLDLALAVAEVNNGGEMVEATLRVVDDNVAYTAVHTTRGKVVRAEPVSEVSALASSPMPMIL